MRTAVRLGAVAVNYVEADELETNGGLVGATVARDVQTQERFELRAKVVFNATGVSASDLRRRAHDFATTLTAISRGSHITLPASFLPGSTGMMIPSTVDGHVLIRHSVARPADSGDHGCRGQWHDLGAARHRTQKSSSFSTLRAAICRHRLRRPTCWRPSPGCGRCFRHAQRKNRNQDNLARARDRDRAPEPDHRGRRQVDHLSQDGARRPRSGREEGTTRCTTLHHRRHEA